MAAETKTGPCEAIVGVDIGGTKMMAVVYDRNFTKLGVSRKRSRDKKSGDSEGRVFTVINEALQEAGLLDEEFFMYGEDLDLCYRIKQFGWRVVYNPSVTVLHVKGAASRKNSRRAIVAFYEAMRIFHNKHYRSKTPLPINWLVDLGISLLCRFALLRDRLTSSGQKRVASA